MSMIKFKATPEQVREIGANASNASTPAGMGILHFQPGNIPIEHFSLPDKGDFSLDYVQGRMVKLNIWKKDNHWEIRDVADPEYQSWCRKYPTARSLLLSVSGVEII